MAVTQWDQTPLVLGYKVLQAGRITHMLKVNTPQTFKTVITAAMLLAIKPESSKGE